jgi:hypothetical protein
MKIIKRSKGVKGSVLSIMGVFKIHWILILSMVLPLIHTTSPQSLAFYDPLTSPNSKYGIHIISPVEKEVNEAVKLVNSSGGDWGYVTVVIEDKDRDKDKWQKFFNDLRRKHLIPLVRIATTPEGSYWKRPDSEEPQKWADFLDSLIWPTQNRYVIIYNEPNHATEWGNSVDAQSYALVLDQTITALKHKSANFFVINAGFDTSAPQKLPAYQDELEFLEEMNQAIPGIFNRLDGWSSHAYPNPNFSAPPTQTGRISIKGYEWELSQLKRLGLQKNLPIFITETGWKHSEGISLDKSLNTPEKVSEYYKEAFEKIWIDPRIVAITPFLLDYQQPPFDHFSFMRMAEKSQQNRVLGVQYPEYYPHYLALQGIQKPKGKPLQSNQARLVKGTTYNTMVVNNSYNITLTFKNTGESIWGEDQEIKLVAIKGAKQLQIKPTALPLDQRVEPGQEYTFTTSMTAPPQGTYEVALQLFDGEKQFETQPITFQTSVKEAATIQTKASLKWKEDFSGEYLLQIVGILGDTASEIMLNSSGNSEILESKYLLPDYEFDFTLAKPFYKPKTIHQRISSGLNVLDFGELQPDIPSAILNPPELWRILPWSN